MNFYCIKQIDYIFPCVCNRSQMTSQRVKNNSHATRLRLVLFCPLHAVTLFVIYYSTHTRKNGIYLLNRILWSQSKYRRMKRQRTTGNWSKRIRQRAGDYSKVTLSCFKKGARHSREQITNLVSIFNMNCMQ